MPILTKHDTYIIILCNLKIKTNGIIDCFNQFFFLYTEAQRRFENSFLEPNEFCYNMVKKLHAPMINDLNLPPTQ